MLVTIDVVGILMKMGESSSHVHGVMPYQIIYFGHQEEASISMEIGAVGKM